MELSTQLDLAQRFNNWFNGSAASGQGKSIKGIIEDNRARYRMLLADYQERVDRGLSALASTKSTSIVDNAVIDAIQEYYATDAITFTAEDSGDVSKDKLADWLTEIFHYRARKNGFWVWHIQSLKAGFVDGIESGMVRWRKESYEVPDNHYYNIATGEEITREEYNEAKRGKWPLVQEGAFDPSTGKPQRIRIKFEDMYRAERQKKTRIVTDTWEVCQLKPGENLLWDFKNPLMDLDKGQWCIVVLSMQKDEIISLSRNKVFKQLNEEEIKPYLKASTGGLRSASYSDFTSAAPDPDTVDMGEYNTGEVWCCFEKVNCEWKVSFSLRGEYELQKARPCNDVFFGGRPYDGLPVFMGASDIELWENIGRGIPKLIAPLEDEYIDHRNNINDIGKKAVTGTWRVNSNSDVDIDSLLNDSVFYADPTEVEKIDLSGEMAVVLRAADGVGADIAEVAPVGMQSQFLVPKGSGTDTLGAAQLALGNVDKKLSTRLLVRNITVMQKLLRIIAEMEFAFETNDTIGRICGKKAKIDLSGELTTVIDGKPAIDWSQLDFDVEVQINAGLGNTPKQQKAQKMLMAIAWAKQEGIPVDKMKVWKQVMVLNGFSEDQFDDPNPQPPQPPPVKYSATVNIDLDRLLEMAPAAGQHLLKLMMEGNMNLDAKIKESDEAKQRQALIREMGKMGSPSHPLVANAPTTDAPQMPMA